MFSQVPIYALNQTDRITSPQRLRGSLPKSGPLDFATKNSFPIFFAGEEALVGIYLKSGVFCQYWLGFLSPPV